MFSTQVFWSEKKETRQKKQDRLMSIMSSKDIFFLTYYC